VNLNIIILIICSVITIEGAILLISPSKIKKMIREILEIPDGTLRLFAVIMTITGLIIIYFLRDSICR